MFLLEKNQCFMPFYAQWATLIQIQACVCFVEFLNLFFICYILMKDLSPDTPVTVKKNSEANKQASNLLNRLKR